MRKKLFLRLSTLLMAICLLAGLLQPQPAVAADSDISYRVEGDTLIYSGAGMVKTSDLAPESVRNQVKHVIVEPGITKLTYVFMNNSQSLETVTLPEGLTEIQMNTFKGCTNLKSINIPSTVTVLQDHAFTGLAALESVVLPEGLETLGSSAFSNCTSLKQVTIPGGVVDIPSYAFLGCASLEEVVISGGVRSIGNNAFSECSALKRVVIPNTVASIDVGAFASCTQLEEITLPASVTSLHPNAFYSCDNLRKITFLGTREQWGAFEPLVIRQGSLRDPAVYFSGEVECLGTGASVTVKVTFDANGGTVSPAQKEVVYGENYGTLPIPVNGAKIFDGWYTQPEGGTAVNSAMAMTEMGDHTLYAHWGAEAFALTPAKTGAAFIPVRSPEISVMFSPFTVISSSNIGCETGSYLFANEKGGLTLVQVNAKHNAKGGIVSDKVFIAEMDSNFNITAQGFVPVELGYWGGFYAGEQYNYLIFAQSNPEKLDSCEVVRVVKYDKDWNRLCSGSVYGSADIIYSFANGTGAGTMDCVEYNGFFYIHAARTIYSAHQACMTLIFRVSDMKNTFASSFRYNNLEECVSHAYDMQILVDREGRLVSLDLGDAGPRAIVLHQYQDADLDNGVLTAVGTDADNLYNIHVKNYHVQEIAGLASVYNTTTGCTVGGMAEAGDYYLVVYQYDPALSATQGDNGDLFYQFVDKETLTGTSVKLADAKVSGVQVLPVDSSSGYIFWADYKNDTTIYYTTYGNGTVGAVRRAEGYRSSSIPILYQGKLVWYVDVIESQPSRAGDWSWSILPGLYQYYQYYRRFYTLDPDTGAVTYKDFMMTDTLAVSRRFTDVPANTWYVEAVDWAVKNDVTSGTGNGTTFSPGDSCTRAQIVTFLYRAYGEPGHTTTENPFSDVKAGDYYYDAVLWAVENGITSGTGDGSTFSPDQPCTRAQAVTFQWRAAKEPSVAGGSSFADVPAGQYYTDAVAWAVANSITSGTGNGTTFSPDDSCTRSQIVTFLYRQLGA